MAIRFDGQVAIVTGAGGGLGSAYALALADRGARVVVNDRSASRDGMGSATDVAASVVARIEAAGGEACSDSSDVGNHEQVTAMVESVMRRWGRIDILINNAGILRDRTFAKVTLEDFRAVI